MEESKNYNRQLEINDLIDDAINSAVTRRGLVETLSDEEATSIAGGLTSNENTKLAVSVDKEPYAIAGFKPIDPYCPPTKPPIKPINPVCRPIKPICPPIIAGMIAPLPDRDNFSIS